MNPILLAIFSVLAVGTLSLVLLKNVKPVQWALLFIANAFLLWTAYRLYGGWQHGDTTVRFLFLSFRNTPTGWLFFAMTSVVTLLFSLFSLSYNDRRHATGIAPLWTMLMAANAAIFLAADWITFIVAWELMSWTSFFIISHGREKSFRAGIYYYALSLIGASTLLAAVFIQYGLTGTFDISLSISRLVSLWGSHRGLVYLIAVLFAITFFTKSALGPFYMWPAKAHAEAPDDFSAFLSGVMIKYGVYGFIVVLTPLFAAFRGTEVNGTPVFMYVLGWTGALTAVWGTFLAIRENDMKRLMAFSTVSNMGFILVALSVNTVFGVVAAVFHTFNHMVFKGTIFLSMASVKFRTGERDMHRLGGMAYRMPVAFFSFLFAIIAAAGIPPMSGFASKWMVFQSLFTNNLLFLAIPAFVASTGAFMYLYRGLHSIYLGQLSPRFADIKAAPPLQILVMGLFSLAIFAVGAFPGLVLVPIRDALGAASVSLDMYSITGTTSTVNMTIVAGVFIGAFLVTVILYILGKKRTLVAPLDTYTAGETPEDWGMTPEQYHYAYRFYEPFEKMTNPMLETLSFEKWFERITFNLGRLSAAFGRWLARPGTGTLVVTAAVLVILITGVMLWQ